MADQTTIKLVRGVHPHTPLPKSVPATLYPHRVALVFDSYASDKDDMFFDSFLFLRLAEVIGRELHATSLQIRVSGTDEKTRVISTLKELTDFYANIAEDDRDLPDEMTWFDRDLPIAAAFPEKWYAVGGPEIYHDSFTLSIFTARDIFTAIHKETIRICGDRLVGVYETRERA